MLNTKYKNLNINIIIPFKKFIELIFFPWFTASLNCFKSKGKCFELLKSGS